VSDVPSGTRTDLSSREGFLANTWLVARRELRERIRGRLFFVSTVLLAGLAVAVAMTPILVKMVDRGSTTTVVVSGSDDSLTLASVRTLEAFLNPKDLKGEPPPYAFVAAGTGDDVAADVLNGRYAGALLADRQDNGQVQFQLLVGESLAADKVTQINVGILAIAIFDFVQQNPSGLGAGFQVPTFDSAQVGASGGGAAAAVAPSEYAGRRIVGVVFVVLIFITLVIYGMWVAAAVVAEKSSRVMELLISAASPRQLVVGKVLGIGGAGLTQYLAIATPAVLVLAFQDRIAGAVLGPGGAGLPTGGLTIGLLAAYGLFFLLGFALFALIYAAVGSFVSRPDDLQTLSLPLSMVAMAGYLSALIVLLGGGAGGVSQVASLLPPFSPFAMLARLMVSDVNPVEVAIAVAILVGAIALVALVTVRIYATGVLLYGQRPGLRGFIAAARRAG